MRCDMDLIEINGDELPDGMKRIALGPILAQHRKRYVLRTAIGDILLKRITALEAEEVTVSVLNSSPDFPELVERAGMLREKAKAQGLQGEDVQEYVEIGKQLEPIAKLLAMRCFVDPKITSIEEYDALMSALSLKDGSELETLLAELSKTGLDGEVSSAALVAAKENGIPLANDMTIENMTAQQSAALTQQSERQNARLTELLSKARKG